MTEKKTEAILCLRNLAVSPAKKLQHEPLIPARIGGCSFLETYSYSFSSVNPLKKRRAAARPPTSPKRVWVEQFIPSSGRVGPFCLRAAFFCKAKPSASLRAGLRPGLAKARRYGIGPLRWLRRGYELKPSPGREAPHFEGPR